MIERIIYECEHCHKKRLISKGAMKNHEEKCWWNLKNKTCVTCWHDNGWFDNNPEDGEYRKCFRGIEFNSPKPKTHCPLWKEYTEGLEELEAQS